MIGANHKPAGPGCLYEVLRDEVLEPARESPEVIAKAVQTVHTSIAERLMAENPGMSLVTAMAKAADTAEMTEMHRQERRMRLGPGY